MTECSSISNINMWLVNESTFAAVACRRHWVRVVGTATGKGLVVDLLLGLRRRQVLVPHALDRYLSVQDVVRGTICWFGEKRIYCEEQAPCKTPKINRFGQKWKYGPKYAKFNFQADGHLIFGLWCPTNEYFAKNWSILYNRGLPGISALPERRENSKSVM